MFKCLPLVEIFSLSYLFLQQNNPMEQSKSTGDKLVPLFIYLFNKMKITNRLNSGVLYVHAHKHRKVKWHGSKNWFKPVKSELILM